MSKSDYTQAELDAIVYSKKEEVIKEIERRIGILEAKVGMERSGVTRIEQELSDLLNHIKYQL